MIGVGFDVHRLVEGRALILGGVEIPYRKGLLGHSDGDVLTHAICDALLGAAGKGDIGEHFPDSDTSLSGISSLLLLKRVRTILAKEDLNISNIDAIILAESPRLTPYKPVMKKAIADVLGLALVKINIKATTPEGLGFAGREEGMAAYAVAEVVHV